MVCMIQNNTTGKIFLAMPTVMPLQLVLCHHNYVMAPLIVKITSQLASKKTEFSAAARTCVLPKTVLAGHCKFKS